MTDSRMGDALWPALERLPRGSGVVFRHYDVPDRVALWHQVRAVARRRRLVLISAGGSLPGGAGSHNARAPRGLVSRAVHSRRQAIAAARDGVDIVFVSPVHATRSHPGAPALGVRRLRGIVRGLAMPVIALGGMDARRARALGSLGIYGWAGIDAWLT